ncbi:MAG: tetraacyldisaccharide 4'-kinase [Bryobacteraceae bacterium]
MWWPLCWLLYWAARIVAAPLLLFYFAYRGYRDPQYFRHVGERLGTLPPSFKRTAPGAIWLHAVSVGEVISCIRLIDELRTLTPDTPVYVSTTTLAGRAVAEQKLAAHVDGVFYAPVDYGFAVRRVLRRIRPAVVVVLETEIWPVLYREVKRAQCGLLILNGRMSDRTAGRYASLRWLFRSVLALPDAIFVQTDRDRMRYLAAGAPDGLIQVAGNLKYDAVSLDRKPPKFVIDVTDHLRPSAVWIAASTMPGMDGSDLDEDDAVLRAFRDLESENPKLLLIAAPRRPERFLTVEQKLRESHIRYIRRSAESIDPGVSLPCVLLLDTIGELASIFPYADVVFMGGTLARRGGHNVLEPAACGKPIVVGPHMENFTAIAEEFRAADAWIQIRGQQELAPAVSKLLLDSTLRTVMGARAAGLARKHTGAASRAAGEVIRAQDSAIPDWHRSGPSRPLLWLLSRAWTLGGPLKPHQPHSLETPVISIGGISMGGSGKTPFVEMLSAKLREQGGIPAVLTRGYRRRSLERIVIVEAGSSASRTLTGDEAQIFVRSGCAHVGIGADRWATGRLLQEKLRPSVFVLDDGFQHRKLARQLDIVLIDGLDPFPGGAVFPLGFLREPLEALSRAQAFVITRAQPNRAYAGIRARLRSLNPNAPVLTSRVEPRYWVNERTKQRLDQIDHRVAAFCGLASPATFWQTLSKLGIEPVFAWAFGDHHHYRPRELRRLVLQAESRGASALVTTEKDAMNLPDNALDLLGNIDLYWLKIETVVQEPEQVAQTFLSVLHVSRV